MRSIGNFVAKKVADRLRNLKQDDPAAYADAWEALAPFVKIGAMEDEKFADPDRRIDSVRHHRHRRGGRYPDPIGAGEKSFTTLAGYRARLSSDHSNRILYSTDDLAQASALNLWTSQGAEVLKLETVIDTQFIPWLESRHDDLKFQRVDAELDDSFQDDQTELSDQDGTTQSETLRTLLKDALANDKVTIQVQSLKADNAPPDDSAAGADASANDMGALMEQRLPGLPDHHVLLVNRRHPLVEGLLKLKSGSVLVGAARHRRANSSPETSAVIFTTWHDLGLADLNPMSWLDSRPAALS